MKRSETKVNDLGQHILESKYYQEGETSPEDVFYRTARVLSIPDVLQELSTRKGTISKDVRAALTPYEDLFDRVVARRGLKCNHGRCSTKKIEESWDAHTDRYYTHISDLDIMPATPMLMNSGKPAHLGMLASCFFLRIDDSLQDIFSKVKDVAWISKLGGGVGLDISGLRPEGTPVQQTNGTSSGPISFLDVFNATGDTVKQGAARRAALLAAMRVDHPDIIKFIRCKKQEGRLANFNISVLVTDEFMNALNSSPDDVWTCYWNDQPYWLDRVTGGHLQSVDGACTAKELWDLIVENVWNNGEPGVLFDDSIQTGDVFGGRFGELGVNPCQPEDALLLDGDRLARIRDGGTHWDSWVTGKHTVYKYTCNNGLEIRATHDHKIQLDDGNFVPISDAVGKEIAWGLGTRTYTELYPKYVLLGFLFGDGFICGNGHGVSAKLNPINEPEIVELLESYGFNHQPSGAYYRNKSELEHTLDINLDVLHDNVHNRNIPDHILCGKTDVVASFLVGLWSANGSCNVGHQGSLKGTNRKMLLDVQVLLASFGIQSWLCTNAPQTITWKNGTYSGKESYNLQIAPRNMGTFVSNVGGFLHKAKMDRVQYTGKPYVQKLKIVGVETIGEQEVWDYRMRTKPHYNLCQGVYLSNCGELPLLSYESCILAAINLSNIVEDREINYDKLESLVYLGVNMLDNAIDVNSFPLDEIEKASLRGRKIGLGSMGLHDLLLKLGLTYGSKESLEVIDSIYTAIREAAKTASKINGKVRGIPNELAALGLKRRNSALLTVQPTGTISIFCGCSSGIEPNFDWEYNRKDSYGETKIRHFMLEQFPDGLPDYAKSALEIPVERHIAVQAAVQVYIDSSISKTCNLPHTATPEDISRTYKQAYASGCKSITAYRSGSRKEEVLSTGQAEVEIPKPSVTRERPRVLYGATYRMNTPGGKAYITINEDREGIREVFIHISKAGSEIQTHVEAEGRLISNSLKYRMPVDALVGHLTDHKSNPIFDNGTLVKSVPDAVAQVIKEYGGNLEGFSEYLEVNPMVPSIYAKEPTEQPTEKTGDLCPECGEILYRNDKCPICISCGYSQCS